MLKAAAQVRCPARAGGPQSSRGESSHLWDWDTGMKRIPAAGDGHPAPALGSLSGEDSEHGNPLCLARGPHDSLSGEAFPAVWT